MVPCMPYQNEVTDSETHSQDGQKWEQVLCTYAHTKDPDLDNILGEGGVPRQWDPLTMPLRFRPKTRDYPT